MAVAVVMPKQGQSVESCIVTKWNKSVGDTVAVGDVLFEYETDKASFEEEAKVAGTLLAVFAEEGDDVPCMTNILVIGEPGESYAEFAPAGAAEEEPEAKAEEVKEEAKEEAPVMEATGTVAAAGERIKISPRARHAAENKGLDISLAIPTGPNGRIIERDIVELVKSGRAAAVVEEAPAAAEAPAVAAAPAPAVGEYEDIKHSGVRKAIAKSMTTSLSTMAQLTNKMSFDATAVLEYRKRVKAAKESMGLENITLNDMILFAVSRVIKNHPDLNAHYFDTYLRRFTSVNLGMAVDTPRGLLVPTIFGSDNMSLEEISRAAKAVAADAQTGKINPDLLAGGTFTISNLGSLGVEGFTPVINPPQTGILGVCGIEYKLKKDGSVYPAMGLCLTYDHRAIDGAPASRFLKDLCTALENFDVLLAR